MAADTTTSPAPDARFLVAHPAHFIALGFGVGLAPVAPGTLGTLVAFPIYWLLAIFLPPLAIAFLAIPFFLLGVWACGVTGRALGEDDHGSMVWDEIVAFLPLLAISAASVWLQLFAFLLFRLFDVWKPWPVGVVDKRVKGGFGAMLDDALAGFYAYVTFVAIVLIAVKVLG